MIGLWSRVKDPKLVQRKVNQNELTLQFVRGFFILFFCIGALIYMMDEGTLLTICLKKYTCVSKTPRKAIYSGLFLLLFGTIRVYVKNCVKYIYIPCKTFIPTWYYPNYEHGMTLVSIYVTTWVKNESHIYDIHCLQFVYNLVACRAIFLTLILMLLSLDNIQSPMSWCWRRTKDIPN